MDLQFIMKFCVIVVGVSCLMSCQPPTPRIVQLERPAYAVVTSSGSTAQDPPGAGDFVEQASQVHDPVGLLPHEVSRHR